MKYFRLSQDKDITNPLIIEELDHDIYLDNANRKKYDQAHRMSVAYFKNSPEIEKPDVLYLPTFLISDKMKELIKSYHPKMPFKGIRCYSEDMEDLESYLYWWPYIRKENCLSKKAEKFPTGTIKNLIINETDLAGKHIFRVEGILENIVIISLELAESMLRRHFWGMQLIPVDTAKE